MRLTFNQTQDQEPKERRVIHLQTAHGEMIGVPDVYDLRLYPVRDAAISDVMIERPGTDFSPSVWRGPTPIARALVVALIHAIEQAESGRPIDVAALAQTLSEQP